MGEMTYAVGHSVGYKFTLRFTLCWPYLCRDLRTELPERIEVKALIEQTDGTELRWNVAIERIRAQVKDRCHADKLSYLSRNCSVERIV